MTVLKRQIIDVPLDELLEIDKTFERLTSIDANNVSDQYLKTYENSKRIAYRNYTIAAVFQSFKIRSSQNNHFTIETGDTLTLGEASDLFIDSFELGFFVVSLRNHQDEYNISSSENDSLLKQLFMDAWGTAFIGSGEKWLNSYIETKIKEKGLHMTNSFGPGQGNIPLEMQPIILNNLQASQIGVSISSHLVMSPKKTVTGIFGIQKKPLTIYLKPCDVCDLSNDCPTSYS